jgi:prepilin-type processing-associated H-X9-DG protein
VNDVRNPGRCALFGDGEYVGGANKFMRSPWPSPGDTGFSGRAAGTQGFRHRGRTNVVFCDGHAESLGTACTDTEAREKKNIAPGTGFLSRDNSLYTTE